MCCIELITSKTPKTPTLQTSTGKQTHLELCLATASSNSVHDTVVSYLSDTIFISEAALCKVQPKLYNFDSHPLQGHKLQVLSLH